MHKTEVTHKQEFREKFSPFSWDLRMQRRVRTITTVYERHMALGGIIKWWTRVSVQQELGAWEDYDE